MRKAEFYVPSEVVTEFVEALEEKDFESTITGTSDDGELILEVEYERDELSDIDELESYLERLVNELEEEEDDDEEEEEEEEEEDEE